MIKIDKITICNSNKCLWPPVLHQTIRKVSLWKIILTQFKTKIFHHQQLHKVQENLHPTISTKLKYVSENYYNLCSARKVIRSVKVNSIELRHDHLLRHTSLMDIKSKKIPLKQF